MFRFPRGQGESAERRAPGDGNVSRHAAFVIWREVAAITMTRRILAVYWLWVSGAAGLASANDQAKTWECRLDAMILQYCGSKGLRRHQARLPPEILVGIPACGDPWRSRMKDYREQKAS